MCAWASFRRLPVASVTWQAAARPWTAWQRRASTTSVSVTMSASSLAPGRLTLGVGIGGEDQHEVEICGVDQRTRGRRMDECLQILRALVVGGRSEAALVREVAVAADRDPSKFEHAMNVWCGFGATREEGRAVVAAGMENFYRIPAAVGELRRLLRTVD